MTHKQRVRRSIVHLHIALLGLISIGGGLYWFQPFGMNSFGALLFSAMSVRCFYRERKWHESFATGYGAGYALHQILVPKRVLVGMGGGLSCNGRVPNLILQNWQEGVSTFFSLAIFYFVICWTFEDPDLRAIALLGLYYACARLLALAAEVYVWFAAERHRLWHIHEGYLRHQLSSMSMLRPEDIEAIVLIASSSGLLVNTAIPREYEKERR